MSDSINKYPAEMFFKDEESIFILRFEEFTKDACVYHSHEFVEICYVCSGSGFHIVNGREYKVHKGDLFIINYDMSHTFYKEGIDSNLITYNIIFKPNFIDHSLIHYSDFRSFALSFMFKDINADVAIKEDLRLSISEQKDFDVLIDNMYREFTTKQEGYRSIIRAYMIELIVKIMRSFCNRGDKGEIKGDNAYYINTAIQFLQENYSKKLNLNELAIKSLLSKNYFCKYFKEVTGMTSLEYIQILRINEACKLLELSKKKVTDIALEVGFSDYKAFSKVFKRIKGILPKEYRKQNT